MWFYYFQYLVNKSDSNSTRWILIPVPKLLRPCFSSKYPMWVKNQVLFHLPIKNNKFTLQNFDTFINILALEYYIVPLYISHHIRTHKVNITEVTWDQFLIWIFNFWSSGQLREISENKSNLIINSPLILKIQSEKTSM